MTPTQERLRLQAGDVIEVRVFREPDLAGIFQVALQGGFSFPLVGEVQAAGKSPFEVARALEERLADGYIRNPQVTVLVKERRAAKIFVLGQVSRPGTFDFEPGMTVIQAISNAGGFTAAASTNSVRITRRRGNKDEVLASPIDDIREGKIPNIYLVAGDIVFVPEALF
jgi:polysaccharide export outer membrane protein